MANFCKSVITITARDVESLQNITSRILEQVSQTTNEGKALYLGSDVNYFDDFRGDISTEKLTFTITATVQWFLDPITLNQMAIWLSPNVKGIHATYREDRQGLFGTYDLSVDDKKFLWNYLDFVDFPTKELAALCAESETLDDTKVTQILLNALDKHGKVIEGTTDEVVAEYKAHTSEDKIDEHNEHECNPEHQSSCTCKEPCPTCECHNHNQKEGVTNP